MQFQSFFFCPRQKKPQQNELKQLPNHSCSFQPHAPWNKKWRGHIIIHYNKLLTTSKQNKKVVDFSFYTFSKHIYFYAAKVSLRFYIFFVFIGYSYINENVIKTIKDDAFKELKKLQRLYVFIYCVSNCLSQK